MKKVALIVALVGCMTIGNYAVGQDAPPPPPTKERSNLTPDEKAEKRTQRMTEDLGLSEDQAVKIKEINMNHIQQMEQIHAQMKTLKDEAKALHDDRDAAVSEVLTPEQLEKHKAKIAERKEKRAACKAACKKERKSED